MISSLLLSLALAMVLLQASHGFRPTFTKTAVRSAMSMSTVTPTAGSLTAKYVATDRLDVKVSASTDVKFDGDLLVVPFYKPKVEKDDEAGLIEGLKAGIPASLDSSIKDAMDDYIAKGFFKGDGSKQVRVYTPSASVTVALVGLGLDPKKETSNDIEVATASKLGKSLASLAKDTKAANIGLVMPAGMGNAGMTQFFLGLHDGSYVDNRFRKVPEGGSPPHLKYSLSMLGCGDALAKDMELTHKLSSMIADGVDLARDLVGAPPNSVDPIIIADVAKQIAADHNLKCEVLAEKECKELGMGSYLGVQQGSKYPPQFVHLTYTPENPSPDTVKIALVGKGLTFDSGGYNLKGPGSMIEMMKIDMVSTYGCV
jgi:leucyl aminopeptidase